MSPFSLLVFSCVTGLIKLADDSEESDDDEDEFEGSNENRSFDEGAER